MVLVGADDAPEVAGARGVELDPAGPVARGVGHQRASRTGEQLGVAGPFGVFAGGPGDVGDDVLFERAGEDLDGAPVRVLAGDRRHVVAVACRLPREAGAVRSLLGGTGPSGGEAADPVLEHRPGRRRAHRGEDGQDEHVRVPEHVAAVGGSGHPAGADRGLAFVGGGGQHVIQRVAGRELRLRVSVDGHGRVRPPPGPGGAVLGRQGVEADGVELGQLAGGHRRVGRSQRVGAPRREPLHDVEVAGLDAVAGRHDDPGPRRVAGACDGDARTVVVGEDLRAGQLGERGCLARSASALSARSAIAVGRAADRNRMLVRPSALDEVRASIPVLRSSRRRSGRPERTASCVQTGPSSRCWSRPGALVDAVDHEQRYGRRAVLFTGGAQRGPTVPERTDRLGGPFHGRFVGQLDDPRRVLVDPGDPSGAAAGELGVEQRREPVGPTAEVADPDGYAPGFDADRHGRRACQLRDQHHRVAAGRAADGTELVAGHQHEGPGDPTLAQPGRGPACRVGLVREPDLDVFHVGGDAGPLEPGAMGGTGGQGHDVGEIVEARGEEPFGDRHEQLVDARLGRIGPFGFGDDVDLAAVQPLGHDPALEAPVRERGHRGVGGPVERRLLGRGRGAARRRFAPRLRRPRTPPSPD